MAYTLDEMARALARRDVIKAIADGGILIFDNDLDNLETIVATLMEQKNFYPKALFYINEWAQADAKEASSNVIHLR